MFHRVTYETWVTIVPIIAFSLTFSVFVGIVIGALRMKKEDRDAKANMPFDDLTKE